MAQRRFHYEQAFEHYLRSNRVPYIAVDEAKKTLLPLHRGPASNGAAEVVAGLTPAFSAVTASGSRTAEKVPQAQNLTLGSTVTSGGGNSGGGGGGGGGGSIKSFDFVVYAPRRQRNLLVDVKGRRFGSKAAASCLSNRRMECWVTQDDIVGLARWQELFGRDFQATFVFVYCLLQQPPDALFEELFTFGGKWYAMREVPLEAYRREMVPRSRRWGTVHLPRAVFDRVSQPFTLRAAAEYQSCSRRRVVLC